MLAIFNASERANRQSGNLTKVSTKSCELSIRKEALSLSRFWVSCQSQVLNVYSYDAEKIFCDKNRKVTRVPYLEHVPPNVTACIFWLKNRDPAHWRDARQLEHTLGKYIISDQPMTEEQWIRERATTIDVTGPAKADASRAPPFIFIVGRLDETRSRPDSSVGR
jgi:hypothetical protein